jgi:hypothetical protein
MLAHQPHLINAMQTLLAGWVAVHEGDMIIITLYSSLAGVYIVNLSLSLLPRCCRVSQQRQQRRARSSNVEPLNEI